MINRKEFFENHLADIRRWLDRKSSQTLPSGALGKAVAFTLAQGDNLARFLDYASLTPDNNRVENAIRPFVVGRKNWLFHSNETGAEASC